MGLVTVFTRTEVESVVLEQLRLPPTVDRWAVATAALKRTASVRCPTSRSRLERLTLGALSPIPDVAKEDIETIMDLLLGSGDLVEARLAADDPRTQVFLGPPRFVRRRNGGVVVLGVRPDAGPLLFEEDISARAVALGHLTVIPDASGEDIELLTGMGFNEVAEARWMGHDDAVEAASLVETYRAALKRQLASGPIDGLRVIDPATPVTYYNGRWRTPEAGHTGIYVGRRPQQYGAELWCVVALRDGTPLRMIDLPTDTRSRGCDEAWRLQAAIDANRGHKQVAYYQGTGQGRLRLGISLPPPRWLQRRWDLVGKPATERLGLVAYEFETAEAREEIEFLKEHLWMDVTTAKGQRA